jgi:transcriptional regulator with XRE-family HTH domain
MKTFKERLQRLIDEKKVSQREVSEVLGINEARVSEWLSGKVCSPRRTSIIRLAEYFGCSIEWLSTGIGDPPLGVVQRARLAAEDIARQGLPGPRGLSEQSTRYGDHPEQGVENAEPEQNMIRMYRQLAEMDADTFGEIQTWINDMEKIRPGFTGWFRIEFQNRFPEFDDWKRKVLKKRGSEDHQNRPMEIKTVNGE